MFLFQILIRIQVIARGKIPQIWLQGGATIVLALAVIEDIATGTAP